MTNILYMNESAHWIYSLETHRRIKGTTIEITSSLYRSIICVDEMRV